MVKEFGKLDLDIQMMKAVLNALDRTCLDTMEDDAQYLILSIEELMNKLEDDTHDLERAFIKQQRA